MGGHFENKIEQGWCTIDFFMNGVGSKKFSVGVGSRKIIVLGWGIILKKKLNRVVYH